MSLRPPSFAWTVRRPGSPLGVARDLDVEADRRVDAGAGETRRRRRSRRRGASRSSRSGRPTRSRATLPCARRGDRQVEARLRAGRDRDRGIGGRDGQAVGRGDGGNQRSEEEHGRGRDDRGSANRGARALRPHGQRRVQRGPSRLGAFSEIAPESAIVTDPTQPRDDSASVAIPNPGGPPRAASPAQPPATAGGGLVRRRRPARTRSAPRSLLGMSWPSQREIPGGSVERTHFVDLAPADRVADRRDGSRSPTSPSAATPRSRRWARNWFSRSRASCAGRVFVPGEACLMGVRRAPRRRMP